MKKVIFCALVASFAMLSVAKGQDLKFAHINSQQLIEMMPESDSAQKMMQAFEKDLTDQMEQLQVEFNKKYQVPQTLIDEIVAEGEKQKVKAKDQKELKTSLANIKIQLKALVARDLWDMSEYFHIMNQNNHVVQKALVLLGKDK